MDKMTDSIYLIVEDNLEVAQMNSHYLKQFDTEASCLVVSSPAEAREHLRIGQPRMIIVDILYGGLNGKLSPDPGLALLRDICTDYCDLNVLVYTAEPSRLISLVQLIQKHRGGFVVVNKMELRDSFNSGIRSALQGRHSLTPELNNVAGFSPEEHDILCLMCIDCLSDKEIANRMNMSVRAVQSRIFRLKERLVPDAIEDSDKNARMAACLEARERRLIS